MTFRHRLTAIFSTWPLLLCAALLLLNDLWFKAAAPGFITGKLSDFTGIALVAMLLLARWPRRQLAITVGLSLFFLWWKSPASTGFIDVVNSVLPRPIGRVVDYTDLIALATIPLAARVVRDTSAFAIPGHHLRRLLLVPTIAATLLGVMGTTFGHMHSQVQPSSPPAPPQPPPSLAEPLYQPGKDLPREQLAQLLSQQAWSHNLRCIKCSSPYDGAEFSNDEMAMTYSFPTPTTLSVKLTFKAFSRKSRNQWSWAPVWFWPFPPSLLPDAGDRFGKLRDDLGNALATRYPGLAWEAPSEP